jgi:hypothetical protein
MGMFVRDIVTFKRFSCAGLPVKNVSERIIEFSLVGVQREYEKFRSAVIKGCIHPTLFGACLLCQTGHHPFPVVQRPNVLCGFQQIFKTSISQRMPAVKLEIYDRNGMEGVVADRKIKFHHGVLHTSENIIIHGEYLGFLICLGFLPVTWRGRQINFVVPGDIRSEQFVGPGLSGRKQTALFLDT